MKSILFILMALALFALIVTVSTAEEWQTPEHAPPLESPHEPPLHIFPPLEVETDNDASPIINPVPSLPEAMIPLTVEQLKLTLIDFSPEAQTTDTALSGPEIKFNAGLQSEHFDSTGKIALSPSIFDGETNWQASTVLLFFGLDFNMGAGYFQSKAFMGQSTQDDGCPPPRFLNPRSLGADTKGFNALAGYKLNKNLTLEAGCGYLEQTNKPSGTADEAWAIYAQAILSLAPGVQVVPGIGQIDFNNSPSTAEIDDDFFAGAKWQINF